MICIHCEDEFCHAPTYVYWCSPECCDAMPKIWRRILPYGPEPFAARVRLGNRRPRKVGYVHNRLDDKERQQIRARIKSGEPEVSIAEYFGVSRRTVYGIRQEMAAA